MKQKTVAIIQARMGSSRLPGKVLLPLGGRSILTYLVERLYRTRTVDEVVVATTVHPRDDIIVEECRRHDVACFRGSEYDVLGRYLAAATVSGADIVVRVTADNPFTDPESIDLVVEHIIENGVEYALEDGLPVGTTGEAVTRRLLGRMADLAHRVDEPRWREHVTLYAKENLKEARGEFLQPRPRCDRPEIRLTVDELPDYLLAQEVARNLNDLDFDISALISQAESISAAPAAL